MSRVLHVLVAVALVHVGLGAQPAAASCAPPAYEVSPTTVRPGGTVQVQGEGWFTCQDNFSAVVGETFSPAPREPLRDVAVHLKTEDGRDRIGSVSADDEGRLDADIVIPEDAPAGPAALHISGSVATLAIVATTAPRDEPGAATEPDDGAPQELAETGQPARGLGVSAIAVLGLGAVILRRWRAAA